MRLQAKEVHLFPESAPCADGLYVHVPFCASRCRYCAFYTTAPRRQAMDRYIAALLAEWKLSGAQGGRFESCFFGGGTPGTLQPEDFRAIADRWRADGFAPKEWTVELSPSTAQPERLAVLRAIGVNRISMGVQSFSDEKLAALGRRSSRAQVARAIGHVRAAGFDNFNLDLMIALPGQTPEDLLADIEEAAAHNPAHISTYCLTLDDDAELMAALLARGWRRDDVRERECYLAAWQRLPQLGYRHYEVSNFAKPGRECIHNLNTWNMGSWLGLGPSAASQWGGRRYANVADLARWQDGVFAGKPLYIDEMALTASTLLADAFIFGLRLNDGVDVSVLSARFGAEAVGRYDFLWRQLAEEGLLQKEGTRIFLTTEGRLLADAVGAAVIDVF